MGIETNAAISNPAAIDGRRMALAQGLRLDGRPKAHGGELEIFAPEQPGSGKKEEDRAEPGEKQERGGADVDCDREQGRLAAFQHRKPQRQRNAGRVIRVVHALDLLGDLVGEEAGDDGGHRRHEHDAADDDAEARRDGDEPPERRRRQVRLRPQRRLDRSAAGADQPDDEAVESDSDGDDERQRKADRLPQHCAQPRRQHLVQCFDGIVEHGWCAEVKTPANRHKCSQARRHVCASPAVRAICARAGIPKPCRD